MMRRVVIYKGFRYRIYPNESQIARLQSWEDAVRFLWNLAHEQRLLGLARPRCERVYPTSIDQINDLKDLRREAPWLADVPFDVCNHVLIELDKAWQRCFKGLANRPKWKRKGRDDLGLGAPSGVKSGHPRWRLTDSAIRFPKIGPIQIVIHRALEGIPKTCVITHEGDQWFASIICEIDRPSPALRHSPIVGVDRGIVNIIADSDGRVVENPRFAERASRRLAHAQRVSARREKGSKNRAKANTRIARIHRTVRRQREHFLHELSAAYTKSHGVIVVERLQIDNMTRIGGPLAGKIYAAGWGQFVSMLRYKFAWSGGSLIEVQAAYSSQTCAACGHVDAANRRSQAEFVCTGCGVVAHADVNAAKVLKIRAGESPVTVCGGNGALGRPVKQKLRVVRRVSRLRSCIAG